MLALQVVFRPVRRFARAARHSPDRLLHRLRRRRMLRAIGMADRPRTVLFVCYGNICRSPYAAASFGRSAPPGITVWSAGFVGPGRPTPPHGIDAAERRGIDLRAHRSQLLTSALAAADLVVVMDSGQQRSLATQFGRTTGVVLLGDLDPHPIDTRTVRDPYDQETAVFDAVYERIDRCIEQLVASLPHRS